MKWYDCKEIDDSIVLTARVRLARNLKKYPFSVKINSEQAEKMIEEVEGAVKKDGLAVGELFSFYRTDGMADVEKLRLIERHVISPELASKTSPSALLLRDDEKVSIMINEEDHVRIQTLAPGDNIKLAWDEATRMDDLLEEMLEYAFDESMGYLTSCPTNTGTGLRASFMLHIPVLESTKQLKGIIPAINKLGITVRGTYGEGTDPVGSLYQVSNQMTLGKSEGEIINNLKNIVGQLIDHENRLREKIIGGNILDIEDKVYRALGILQNARKISSTEAINYLSWLRLGKSMGVLPYEGESTIYKIMMNMQAGNIISMNRSKTSDTDANTSEEELTEERDILRANYLRGELSGRKG